MESTTPISFIREPLLIFLTLGSLSEITQFFIQICGHLESFPQLKVISMALSELQMLSIIPWFLPPITKATELPLVLLSTFEVILQSVFRCLTQVLPFFRLLSPHFLSFR